MHTIGYILTAAAVLPAVKQIKHSLRRSSVAGVSGASTWAWVCSWSVWVLYGTLLASGPIVLRNVVGLLPAVALLAVYRKFARVDRWLPVAFGYALAAAALLVDVSLGVWVLVALDVAFYLPSVAAVFRTKDPVGVSLAATAVQLVLTGTWFAYLCTIGQGASGIGWIVGFLSYAVIAWRVTTARAARPLDEPAALSRRSNDVSVGVCA